MLPIMLRSNAGDDLPSSNTTKRPRDEVDQYLFHLALPFANVEDSPADA